MRNDILEKKDEIIKMINDNEPKSRICKMLKCKPITLDGYLIKFGIDYHGNGGLKGKKTDAKRKSAIEYSKKETLNPQKLRKKLIEDKVKKEECEICGLSEWQEQKLSLELHHKDGNRFNNNFENLQILCPNCHSLTPNHSHVKKSKKKTKLINFCSCGNLIGEKSLECLPCSRKKQRKTIRPTYEILINDINEIGYSATGKKYGVSDNGIRKWKKQYEKHTPMAEQADALRLGRRNFEGSIPSWGTRLQTANFKTTIKPKF